MGKGKQLETTARTLKTHIHTLSNAHLLTFPTEARFRWFKQLRKGTEKTSECKGAQRQQQQPRMVPPGQNSLLEVSILRVTQPAPP